jgi:predicted nucleic acid-binding protein
MISRKLSGPQFFLDANRVNAKGKLSAMNQLEKWHADGVIRLKFPEYAQNEAESGRDARRTQKAREYLIPQTAITTDEERERLRKIERIIFGDGPLSSQDKNDALNVFTAQKYFAILVTADQKLLQAAPRLRSEIGTVDVMTDESAVEQVRQRIRVRDRMARAAARKGCPLPDWVGKDLN